MQTIAAHIAYMYTYSHAKHSKHTNQKSVCTYMHNHGCFQEHTFMHTYKKTKNSSNRHSRCTHTHFVTRIQTSKQPHVRTHNTHPSIHPYTHTQTHTSTHIQGGTQEVWWIQNPRISAIRNQCWLLNPNLFIFRLPTRVRQLLAHAHARTFRQSTLRCWIATICTLFSFNFSIVRSHLHNTPHHGRSVCDMRPH